MGTLKTKEIEQSLIKKGFKLDEKRDHKFFIFYLGDKKTRIRTKISLGEKEIDDSLINLMAKDTKLSKRNFLDLIACPLSEDAYISIVKEQGLI